MNVLLQLKKAVTFFALTWSLVFTQSLFANAKIRNSQIESAVNAFNKNTSLEVALLRLKKIDEPKYQEFKNFFNSSNVDIKTPLPQVKFVNENISFAFDNEKYSMKFLESNELVLTNKDKSITINKKLTAAATMELIQQMMTPKTSSFFGGMLISEAHASLTLAILAGVVALVGTIIYLDITSKAEVAKAVEAAVLVRAECESLSQKHSQEPLTQVQKTKLAELAIKIRDIWDTKSPGSYEGSDKSVFTNTFKCLKDLTLKTNSVDDSKRTGSPKVNDKVVPEKGKPSAKAI